MGKAKPACDLLHQSHARTTGRLATSLGQVNNSSNVAEVVASPVENETANRIDADASVDENDADAESFAIDDGGDPAGLDSFDGAVEGGARIIPTPPKTRNNPSSKTPPRRGSRGGNLALSTSSISWAELKVSPANCNDTYNDYDAGPD